METRVQYKIHRTGRKKFYKHDYKTRGKGERHNYQYHKIKNKKILPGILYAYLKQKIKF